MKRRLRFTHKDGVTTSWFEGEQPVLHVTGSMMIHGVASTPTISTNNHSLISRGCRAVLPIPLLCAHEHIGRVGELVYVRRSPEKIYVRALLDDNEVGRHAWKLVLDGTLPALSVAARKRSYRVQGKVDGITFYDKWVLDEVSLCRKGANPDCSCDIFRGR